MNTILLVILGNVFEQAEKSKDANEFGLNYNKMPKLTEFKDIGVDFVDTKLKTTFDHSYLVSKFGEGPVNQLTIATPNDVPCKSFFNEVEIQSTAGNRTYSASPSSDRCVQEEKGMLIDSKTLIVFLMH